LIIYLLKIRMERGTCNRVTSVGILLNGKQRKSVTKTTKTTIAQKRHIEYQRNKLDPERKADTKVVRYQGWFSPAEAAMTMGSLVQDWMNK